MKWNIKKILWVIALIILPPISVNFLMMFRLPIVYGNDWQSFFGSYLGGITAVIGAYIVARTQIKHERMRDGMQIVALILSELEWNEKVCASMIKYFKVNDIESVWLDKDTMSETRKYNDGSKNTEYCPKGKGIIHNTFDVDHINKTYLIHFIDEDIHHSLLNLRNGLKMANSCCCHNKGTLMKLHDSIIQNIKILEFILKIRV